MILCQLIYIVQRNRSSVRVILYENVKWILFFVVIERNKIEKQNADYNTRTMYMTFTFECFTKV